MKTYIKQDRSVIIEEESDYYRVTFSILGIVTNTYTVFKLSSVDRSEIHTFLNI